MSQKTTFGKGCAKLNESSKALEEQNGTDLVNIKTKFTSDSVAAQTNYDTQLTGLKDAALVKNKELVAAEIELNKLNSPNISGHVQYFL